MPDPQMTGKIALALARSLESAERRVEPVEDLRLILLSDQHRGTNDGADDFRKCKSVYHAALGFYFHLDYSLLLLGDVEELWERNIRTVVKHYADTLELERQFLDANRYERFIGNHDEKLAKPKYRRHLHPFIGEIVPRDALVLQLTRNGAPAGELLFVHGHQGIKYGFWQKGLVRYGWATIQWLTGIGSGVPSTDYEVRRTHERAMYEWAHSIPDLILIAGHTHHPVFMSQGWEESVKTDLESQCEAGASPERIAETTAMLEWVRSRSPDEPAAPANCSEFPDPSYYNTGCCSFSDGDVTGIEIEGNEIRLVKWTETSGRPERVVLRAGPLV